MGGQLKRLHDSVRAIFRMGLEPYVDLVLLLAKFYPRGDKPAEFGADYTLDPDTDPTAWTLLAPGARTITDENLQIWLDEPRFKVGNLGDGVALTTALRELTATKASYKRAKQLFDCAYDKALKMSELLTYVKVVLSKNKEVMNDVWICKQFIIFQLFDFTSSAFAVLGHHDACLRDAREDKIMRNLNAGFRQELKRSRLDKSTKEDDLLSQDLVSSKFDDVLKNHTVNFYLFSDFFFIFPSCRRTRSDWLLSLGLR